jgi:hypothetical protein
MLFLSIKVPDADRQTYEKLHKLDYLHRAKPIEIPGGGERKAFI